MKYKSALASFFLLLTPFASSLGVDYPIDQSNQFEGVVYKIRIPQSVYDKSVWDPSSKGEIPITPAHAFKSANTEIHKHFHGRNIVLRDLQLAAREGLAHYWITFSIDGSVFQSVVLMNDTVHIGEKE